MKRNTAALRVEDNSSNTPSAAVHPSLGRSGQETGMRNGMVEAVNGISVCFTCQQVGHINRNCPMRMGQVVSDGTEEAQLRREEKRRREEDKNEFLSALSEAAPGAPPPRPVAGALVAAQAEAKAKKLPAFLAVKKRKDGETEGVEGADPAAGAAPSASTSITSSGSAPSEVSVPAPTATGAGSGPPAPSGGTGIGGLGDYDSSSDEEESGAEGQ